MDEILTVQEVAEYLKVSRTTVWRWCNEGQLPAFRVGRGWRVHRSEMEKIVRQTREQSAKQVPSLEGHQPETSTA